MGAPGMRFHRPKIVLQEAIGTGVVRHDLVEGSPGKLAQRTDSVSGPIRRFEELPDEAGLDML